MEGDQVFKKLNQILNVDFLKGAVDLKKNVSIYTRKQIGQKMEGFSASQF